MIHPSAVVEDGAELGERTVVGAMAFLGSGVRLGDGCVVGAGALLTGEVVGEGEVRFGERSVVVGADGPVHLRREVTIGSGATIVGPLVVERQARIAAGAMVDRSVPALAIVAGNPAVIHGYTDAATRQEAAGAAAVLAAQEPPAESPVRVVRFPTVGDLRGDLTVGNFPDEVPFTPRRFFVVFNVPGQNARGAHAHHVCEQFLIAVRGSVSVVWDDGQSRGEVTLDHPSIGLYLPPMTWGIQYKHSADAVLMVFASHPYDASDYIRDYDDFLRVVAGD
jgi:UDP-2-acetamido-3-amino-2,3-dideoxy-glucuronate N-acetyltransferase